MGDTVRMVSPDGGAAVDVPVEDAQVFADRGYVAEGNAQRAAATVEGAREDYYSRPGAKVAATVLAGARGLTGGASDALIRTFGDEKARSDVAALREHNAGLSTAAEIGGSLVGLGKVAGRVGARVAGTGGGAAAQVARTGVAGATEGAIVGAGQGVSEIALSDDPLTVERVASVMGSNILLGGATGGAIGAGGKAIGLGLRRAKGKLDDIAKKGADAGTDVADADLVNLDAKGLRVARKAELERLEAARVPQRAEVADEIRSFRKELKESKLWLATKGADDAEVRAIGRRTLKADKQLDNLLDDPKALAENPKSALRQLRIQEAALDDLVTKHGEKLRQKFATDTSGTRAKALDFASTALERNRSLQARIAELANPSARLQSIDDALAGRLAPKAAGGVGDIVGDSALGYAVGAAAGIPGLGAVVGAARAAAPLLRKLGTHQAEIAARGSKAIGALLDVGAKVAPAAPVVASKVLGSVRYSVQADEKRAKGKAKKQKAPDLATSFKARAAEIRSQVAPGPTGMPMMRPSARADIADRLGPIRAADPLLADRIETVKARGVEYLASTLPRKPDVMAMQVGPDRWQPSDMEMRAWARRAAVVEDPMGVVERLSGGSVSPEDVEAMKAVYPEMYADIVRQIIEQLPTLQKTLPYQRRLALSIFSGVPVDPAMHPQVLAILQRSFVAEAGSEGGTMAPRPEPAFGSVSKEQPTPAQQRGA